MGRCESRKPILIVFEGVDKSGKTTIKDAFNKRTNFGYVVIDRLTTSSKVYGHLFGRENRLEYYDEFEKAIIKNFDVLVVLCECDWLVNLGRLSEAGEMLPPQLANVDKVQSMFKEKVSESFENFIVIYTSYRSVEECVDDIVSRVREMEDHYE